MSKVLRNVSLLGKHNDTVWYTYNCSCGCGEQVFIELTSVDDLEMVSLSIWATVSAHNKVFKVNRFLNLLAAFWWRVKTACKILFGGSIKMETGIIIDSKEGIQDFITALEDALAYLEKTYG